MGAFLVQKGIKSKKHIGELNAIAKKMIKKLHGVKPMRRWRGHWVGQVGLGEGKTGLLNHSLDWRKSIPRLSKKKRGLKRELRSTTSGKRKPNP